MLARFAAFPSEHALIAATLWTAHTHALDAFEILSRTEGIIPALESAHAIAYALTLAGRMPARSWILVNLSGRGDKDLAEYERIRGTPIQNPKSKIQNRP